MVRSLYHNLRDAILRQAFLFEGLGGYVHEMYTYISNVRRIIVDRIIKAQASAVLIV